MAEGSRRPQLGRGLSALLGAPDETAARDGLRSLPITALRPGRFQPRHRFDDAQTAELAQSIAEKGILQPILVRRVGPEGYEIVAGERRWRAAQQARLHEVPVLVRDLSDREALEVALIENLQRESLSPVDEAEGYRRLLEDFAHTQEALAKVVGKSRSHVANTLRLLGLPKTVREMLDRGDLSAGHGRALVTAKDPAALARAIAARGLNVRQTEALVRAETAGRAGGRKRAKDPDIAALERELAEVLGLKSEIRHAGGRGTLVLHYRSLDQLDGVLRRLRRSPADD